MPQASTTHVAMVRHRISCSAKSQIASKHATTLTPRQVFTVPKVKIRTFLGSMKPTWDFFDGRGGGFMNLSPLMDSRYCDDSGLFDRRFQTCLKTPAAIEIVHRMMDMHPYASRQPEGLGPRVRLCAVRIF